MSVRKFYRYYLEHLFNPIRSGGGALKKTLPPMSCSHAFNFGATLLCVGDFSQRNSLTACGKFLFDWGGDDLAVRGVSKYIVNMIFIILCEFITMLEIIDS